VEEAHPETHPEQASRTLVVAQVVLEGRRGKAGLVSENRRPDPQSRPGWAVGVLGVLTAQAGVPCDCRPGAPVGRTVQAGHDPWLAREEGYRSQWLRLEGEHQLVGPWAGR
jgi:hypothetical protein